MSGKYGEEKTLNKKRHLWLGAALGCVILLLGVGRAWENTYTIRVDTTGLQWVFRAVDKVSPEGGLPRVKAYWLDRETVSINGIEVELKYGYDDRRI